LRVAAFQIAAGGRIESITLPPEPSSVALARGFVRAHLDAHDVDLDVALLLTTELVTNVVRHARTSLDLVVIVEPTFRVEVHDGEAATEAFRALIARPPTNVAISSAGGRGLGLVSTIANRFGLGDEPGSWNGKVVWFELDRRSNR
jgi:anti-sigma regulatory factor (Ser/Thr protein kinase)